MRNRPDTPRREILNGKPAWQGVSASEGFRAPIAHLMHRANQSTDQISSAALKDLPLPLTPRQFVVLLAIADNESARQVDLTNATGVDRSTMADLMRRMKRRGLIARTRSKVDGRANAIRLTDTGKNLLQAAIDYHAKADERIVEQLPRHLRASFLTCLAHLIEAPQEVRE